MGIAEGQILEEGSKIKTFIAIFMAPFPLAITLSMENDRALFPLSVKSPARSVWCAGNESDVCQCEYITADVDLSDCVKVAALQRFNKLHFDNFLRINAGAKLTN